MATILGGPHVCIRKVDVPGTATSHGQRCRERLPQTDADHKREVDLAGELCVSLEVVIVPDLHHEPRRNACGYGRTST